MPQHTKGSGNNNGSGENRNCCIQKMRWIPWLIYFATPHAKSHPLPATRAPCPTLSSIWALRVCAWVLRERVFGCLLLVYPFWPFVLGKRSKTLNYSRSPASSLQIPVHSSLFRMLGYFLLFVSGGLKCEFS